MAVYMVIVDYGVDAVRAQLQKRYGNAHYEYRNKNDIFFVYSDEAMDKVSRNLGITGDNDLNDLNGVAGVVLKMDSAYTDFTEREFWNWLSEYEH